MVRAESASRDFADYESKLISHPLERTLEKFRRQEILVVTSALSHGEPPHVLEVGIGTRGVSIDFGFAKTITIVEPIKRFIEDDRFRSYNCSVHHFNGTLNEFYLNTSLKHSLRFNLIILSSVLHEIPNPKEALVQLKELLHPNGFLILVVPNRESFHRLIGKALGIHVDSDGRTLTESEMGQRAAYTLDELKAEVSEKGFEIKVARTFLPKLLSSAQLAHEIECGRLSHEFLSVSYQNSKAFEPFGSEIILLAQNPSAGAN